MEFMPQHSPSRSHAVLVQQHSRSTYSEHSRRSTYAAALTPPHSFAALTPPQWCCHSHRASFMHHLARSRIFRSQHSRCRSHAAEFTPLHYAAARAPQHFRCSSPAGTLQVSEESQRTTWSAFSNAKHNAGGRELGRAGCGRGLIFLGGVSSCFCSAR